MSDTLHAALRLDAEGDARQIRALLAERITAPDFPDTLANLLHAGRFFEADLLASLAAGVGRADPVAALARSTGRLLFGTADDHEAATARLGQLTDALPDAARQSFADRVVHPTIAMLMTKIDPRDHDVLGQVLDTYRAGHPRIRATFDWSAPPLPPARVAERPAARLLSFAATPAPEQRVPRRAVVAVRELVFPGAAQSRLLDVGPRVHAGLAAYGWHSRFLPLRFTPVLADFAGIAAACRAHAAELLLLDDWFVLDPATRAPRAALLAELRRDRPGLKIVSINLDPWMIDTVGLLETADLLDFVWTQQPSMPVWRHPVLAGRVMYAPLPSPGPLADPATPMTGRIGFAGGVFGYNWHRAFWLLANRHGLPIDWSLSNHAADGLSVLDSYALYLHRLGATGCALNLAMRPDLSCVITGRSFEALRAGALLIQEDSADMDFYFERGRHYLGFSNVAELRGIVRFIAEQPGAAQRIRADGHAFAAARYSDAAIVADLDARLFDRAYPRERAA